MIERSGQCLYFLHIPKTAGSSVRKWLAEKFSPEQACPAWSLEDLWALNSDRLAQYALFVGHFGQHLGGRLGAAAHEITILRDPISRTLSHWRQINRAAYDPDHARVREQSFDAFVADDRNRYLIENFQARYLAPPAQSLEALAAGLAAPEFATFQLSKRFHQASLTLAPDDLFRGAGSALDAMEVAGTAEDLHGFLSECATRFGWPLPAAEDVPWVNATEIADASEIAASTLRRLEALTEVDRALYDRVRTRAVPRPIVPSTQDRPEAGDDRLGVLDTRLRLALEGIRGLQHRLHHANVHHNDEVRWLQNEVAHLRQLDAQRADWIAAETKSNQAQLDAAHIDREQHRQHARWVEAELKFIREQLDHAHADRAQGKERTQWIEAELKVMREQLDHAHADRAQSKERAQWIEAELKLMREQLDFAHADRERASQHGAALRQMQDQLSRLSDSVERLQAECTAIRTEQSRRWSERIWRAVRGRAAG